MSARELVEAAGARPLLVVALLAAPLVAALALAPFMRRGRGDTPPWRYVYSILVYATTVPGVLAAVLSAYTLFFTGENLLDRDLVVHLLPIAAMGLTLLVISRAADFKRLPGFDRLSGLVVLIALTFVILLVISKTRIWLVFGGSLAYLVALAAGLFALLKWAAHTAFRRPDEAPREPPSLPRP